MNETIHLALALSGLLCTIILTVVSRVTKDTDAHPKIILALKICIIITLALVLRAGIGILASLERLDNYKDI